MRARDFQAGTGSRPRRILVAVTGSAPAPPSWLDELVLRPGPPWLAMGVRTLDLEQWLVRDDEKRADPPLADRRTRAALITAMALGIPLLHEHISRAAGADIRSDEGDRQVAMALLDLYSHPLVTPELAATARAAFHERSPAGHAGPPDPESPANHSPQPDTEGVPR